MKLTKIALLCSVALAPLSSFAAVNKEGDLIIRAGYSIVNPDDKSSGISAGDDLGSGVDVRKGSGLGINAVYFLHDKWAIELLAATPFSHDLVLNPIPNPAFDRETNPDVSPVLDPGGSLGEAKQLPPTLSLLYYWGDNDKFHPYLGIGVNYTMFFDEEFTAARTEAGFSNLSLDNTFGLSAQWGMDIDINDKWLVNMSMRWIDIDTDAEFIIDNAGLGLTNQPATVAVDVDPFVYTLSMGYRF